MPLNAFHHAFSLRLLTLFLLAQTLTLSGCAVQKLVANGVADQLAQQSSSQEDDLILAKDAAPFYLKLSESVLQATPEHRGLTVAVTSGFVQYAYAFVSFAADVVEDQNVAQASQMRERAKRLYRRAKNHAVRYLDLQHPNWQAQLAAKDLPPDKKPSSKWAVQDAGILYWLSAAWTAEISLSKDRPEMIAQLPKAQALAELSYQLDPRFNNGSAALLLGILEQSRPGGSAELAEKYLDSASENGSEASVFLAIAENVALPKGDKDSFVALIHEADRAATRDQVKLGLAGKIVHERAQWLLSKIDTLF